MDFNAPETEVQERIDVLNNQINVLTQQEAELQQALLQLHKTKDLLVSLLVLRQMQKDKELSKETVKNMTG